MFISIVRLCFQIRKALRNEGENGFLRPKGPMYEAYYDDHEGGLEVTKY